MNNQDKVAEVQRIISTAQDELALLMKKGKRFKPEIGQGYWFVEDSGQVDFNPWDKGIYDLELWNRFNCYETEALATKASVIMRRNNAIINACLMVDPDFVPDYLSNNQEHYSFYYLNPELGTNGVWCMSVTYQANRGPCVSTLEKWEEAAALLKEWEIE